MLRDNVIMYCYGCDELHFMTGTCTEVQLSMNGFLCSVDIISFVQCIITIVYMCACIVNVAVHVALRSLYMADFYSLLFQFSLAPQYFPG